MLTNYIPNLAIKINMEWSFLTAPIFREMREDPIFATLALKILETKTTHKNDRNGHIYM